MKIVLLIFFVANTVCSTSQCSFKRGFENVQGTEIKVSEEVVLVGVGSICCSPCVIEICSLYNEFNSGQSRLYFYFDTWIPVYERPHRIELLKINLGEEFDGEFIFRSQDDVKSLEECYNLGYQSPFVILARKTKIKVFKHGDIWKNGVITGKFKLKFKRFFL